MSSNSISDKLLSLWANNRMAHFYIVQPSPAERNPREFVKQWVTDFMAKTLATEKNISNDEAHHKLKIGVADILMITKEDESKNYLVGDEQFTSFYHFQNYKPLELKQRFIVIDDAHSITEYIGNKLLKTFEEPAPHTTIFLLDPFRKKLLPTISSRAIYIRIPTHNKSIETKVFHKLSDYLSYKQMKEDLISAVINIENNRENILPLFECLKGKKFLELEFIEELTQYVNQREYDYKQLDKFTSALKWYQKALVFNNHSPEKLSGLMLSIN